MALTAKRASSAALADPAAAAPGGGQPPKAEPDRQMIKSARTRARLIDATIHCLVQFGYAKTVTPLVAAEAGLSRGAMLHHFPTGHALIRATVAELHERRLNAFRRASQATAGNVHAMVRDYWHQLQKPAFIAFQELAIAARTDETLAAILLPLQVEFTGKFEALALQLYPDWVNEPEQLRLAMAVSQVLMEGTRMACLTAAMDEGLIEPVLTFLEQSIISLRPAGSRLPAVGGQA